MYSLFKEAKILKIGNHYYDIDRLPYTVMDDKAVLGRADLNYKLISVSTAYGESVEQETLMHEVTHALLHEAGLRDNFISQDGIDEEEFTERFSRILTQFLDDNLPQLIHENTYEKKWEEECCLDEE